MATKLTHIADTIAQEMGASSVFTRKLFHKLTVTVYRMDQAFMACMAENPDLAELDPRQLEAFFVDLWEVDQFKAENPTMAGTCLRQMGSSPATAGICLRELDQQ